MAAGSRVTSAVVWPGMSASRKLVRRPTAVQDPPGVPLDEQRDEPADRRVVEPVLQPPHQRADRGRLVLALVPVAEPGYEMFDRLSCSATRSTVATRRTSR